MSAATPAREIVGQAANESRKRGCLFYVRRMLKWLGIIVVTLVVLGVIYQSVATEQDKGKYAPRGQLYTVNSHQMHMVCAGQGSPAVILEAGGYAESLWWYRVQSQLATHTQVCSYDRPGMGWSEPTTLPRDPVTIVGELHLLLSEAGINPPYVLAGHSYGAILIRVFAHQYPVDVAGLVLVDSGLLRPAHFNSEAEFNEWKSSNDVLQAALWVMSRVGLMRLIGGGDFSAWGYPPEIVPQLVALHSSNQAFDTYYAEGFPVRPALQETAAAAQDLGSLPLVILWAGEQPLTTQADLELFEQLKQEMSAYSTNSISRDIEGANHGSILGEEQYAQQVTDAILDVVEATQSG